ncbi:unnamed protein product [Linum tenue]|uniref:SAP domain-containing protein n=1 Tax=Linum tenue TaxID=586396 RepID=A0AAV0QDS7_9ROSI|nr:unnamed protein product [Linum tenue]
MQKMLRRNAVPLSMCDMLSSNGLQFGFFSATREYWKWNSLLRWLPCLVCTRAEEKLAYFRIKELKDVLTQLGLSKQGKKQDLVDRILNVLHDAQGSKAWPKRVFLEGTKQQNLLMTFTGVPVRAINRPGSQLLGANGRDDGPIITPCTKDGINKYRSGFDARVFCLGVRIVKRRTLQILGLIPKESDGEQFEDALSRVCRCVGGGAPTDGADSDSDLEVVADSITVNLRCPWQCPICLKNYSLDSVIVDPFFNRITTKMRHCGEDVTEIEHTKWGGSVKGGGNREASQAGRNNRLQPDNFQQKVIPMTSSGTGSGEDPSVNQDAISAPVAADAAEIIVLSDTDMKNDILVSSGAGFNNNQNDVGAGWPLDSSMHSNREIIIRSMHRRIMVGFDLRIGSLLGWEVVLPAAGGGHGESVPLANGSLTSRHAMPTNRDGAMGSLTDTGAEMPCLSLSRFIFFLETGFFFFFICDAKFLWA